MENLLTYKGHSLARSGNQIYFGNMENKKIIVIKILESDNLNDLKMAKSLKVELQFNDPEISDTDKVIKSSMRTSLYDALDIACIWLERVNK